MPDLRNAIQFNRERDPALSSKEVVLSATLYELPFLQNASLLEGVPFQEESRGEEDDDDDR